MVTPKHRRCTRRRHHQWVYIRTGICWTLARCKACGLEELA